MMKLRYIDALRGLAIIAVMLVHCGQVGANEKLPALVRAVTANGVHGVQLFYVASAFTLFLSLANRNPAERHPWVNFFGRRFFRIAPMYYVGIVYYLWQDGFGPRYWLGDAEGITAANIASNFFFLHGFNPYWINSVVPGGWSIAAEMLFYLLIPVFFLKVKNSQQALYLVLAALFIRAIMQFALNRVSVIDSGQLWAHYLNFYLPSQLPVFALGILLYFVIKEDYNISLSPLAILVTCLVLIIHLAGIPLLPNHFLFSIGFVLLAVALSRKEFRLIVNPVIVHIGKVSFSLYLVHFAVLYWMERAGWVDFANSDGPVGALLNYSIRLLVLMVLSIAIASFFYSVVELPMQRVGKMLVNKLSRKMETAETPALNLADVAQVFPVIRDTEAATVKPQRTDIP